MPTRRFRRPVLAMASAGLLLAGAAAAQNVGMVADNNSKSVVVFDADTLATLASFSFGGAGTMADCVISQPYGLGFVTDFRSRVWVIDLLADPPVLAGGINPIAISNPGEDLAVTADGRFVVVTDGLSQVPISVIDVETMTEVHALGDRASHVAVDVCADGSVLEVSASRNLVRRLIIDDAGQLTAPGENFSFSGANNVYGAPGCAIGLVVGRTSRVISTFNVQGMTLIESRLISGTGVSAAFSASGDTLYVISANPGTLDVFNFDAATGFVDPAPAMSMSLGAVPTFYGADLITLHPDGSKLFVSQPNEVSVYRTSDLTYLGAVIATAIVQPTGVSIADLDGPEPPNTPPTLTAAAPIVLWPPFHQLVDVSSVLSIADADGDDLTVTITAYSDEEEAPTRRYFTSGWHAPDFKDEWHEGGRGILLRAERDWFGNGRVYLLAVTVDDGRGGTAELAVTAAVVPRCWSFWRRTLVLMEASALQAALQESIEFDLPVPASLRQIGLSAPRGPKQ